jgi:hypothetical protein
MSANGAVIELRIRAPVDIAVSRARRAAMVIALTTNGVEFSA